jgi:hypothetical protein
MKQKVKYHFYKKVTKGVDSNDDTSIIDVMMITEPCYNKRSQKFQSMVFLNNMGKQSRELKFREIQEDVWQALKKCHNDTELSYTKIAEDILGVAKARISEVKRGRTNPHPHFAVGEGLLNRMIAGGIMKLEDIKHKIDRTDPLKETWVENQEWLSKLKILKSKNINVSEKLDQLIAEVESEKK